MASGHLLLSCAKRAATTKIDLFAYLWQLPCALCSLNLNDIAPDTGVSNLILVALERLPSMEGTVKIWIICTFLRGAKIQGSPERGAVSEAD